MVENRDICQVDKMTESEKFDLLKEIILDYNCAENNLIQVLHYAQAIFGYLSVDVQKYIATSMDLPLSKVNSVLTFYSFFSTKPKGKYTIAVCLGTACYVRGGKDVLGKLKDLLGIEPGLTTNDKMFSLQVMRCIGACGLAPAMTINGKVFKQVNPNKIQNILGKLE